MDLFILVLLLIIFLIIGATLGYFARQSIAKKRAGTIEAKLQAKIFKAKSEYNTILKEARVKAEQILLQTEKENDQRRRELLKAQQVLLKRENLLENKIASFEEQERDFRQKAEKLKNVKEELERMKQEAINQLEKISGFSQGKAKEELLKNIEAEYQIEFTEKMKKLEAEGAEKVEKRAKEILALAIQKYALPQTQELTTTTILITNEDIKGRIIGKEGRNIKAFEKLTGVEVIVDESPETVVISGFNPIRRQIAKIALEKLIQDGRIQPAKIEEKVEEAKLEVANKIKEAGEKAIYETGVVGLDERLVQLLGRLYFRTSYGQNVLLHSMEVSLISEALADELGVDSQIAKRAGLLHDIGKAIDQQIEGSHVEIGVKILEKFKEDERIIKAVRAHHEEYPAETLEAILVKTADAISGSRPGARKDTLENYLKRLSNLENIATSFTGVEKAYAIQAGRELRVFVKPGEVDDLGAHNLARQIADRIEEELNYPGEIKVIVIRENRVIEYAK